MRFFIFMIIVFGVFLLAIGQGGDHSVERITDSLGLEPLSGNSRITEVTSIPEPGLVEVNEGVPTDLNKNLEPEKPPVSGSIGADVPKPEGIPIDSILTQGEDFTRQQLEKYADGNSRVTRPVAGPVALNRRETLQDIHVLNRDALSTLSRVDSILHSNKRGEK